MIQMRSILDIADNTGARRASMIGKIGHPSRYAHVGDIITINIKESSTDASVKKGEVHKAVIVRTKAALRRTDGSYLRFDTWIVPSRSAILPCGFSWDFLRCFLIMATPSTTARFLAERISRILPDLPLWAPAMTTTTSFFLM